MSVLTPSDLIDDAVLLAFPYASERTVAPGVLLRQLQQLDREVVGMLAQEAPERFSTDVIPGQSPTVTDVAVTLVKNRDGYALQAATQYTDWTLVDSSDNVWPITIVPESKFEAPPVHPAGIVRGSTFFPCDPDGLRWEDQVDDRTVFAVGDTIKYRYIAEVSRVTTKTQALASPEEAQGYLVWSLVLSILLGAGASQEAIQLAAAQRAEQRSNLILRVSKRGGGV
jgi:hypothetical protein